MVQQRCANCGAEVPEETGQHATTPSAGIVQCPNCGANVTLEKPGADPEQQTTEPSSDVPRASESRGGEDYFAGEETIKGVMDEVREKDDG
jgi:DNA-directed RNA polymerase subunit RPC12/RpoP